jgi:hypothetical protein
MESNPEGPRRWPEWKAETVPVPDETAFWSRFPHREQDFRTYAQTTGISLYCDVQRDGIVLEGDNRSRRVDDVRALLPSPPIGYFWVAVTGGLVDRRYQTFRLWHRDFGYGPTAE